MGVPVPGPGGRGVLHPRWWGYPISNPGGGTPLLVRRQSSRVSTCYVVGGLPLAFTQEDLLVVLFCFSLHGDNLEPQFKGVSWFLVMLLLPSRATYLVTMASVCV